MKTEEFIDEESYIAEIKVDNKTLFLFYDKTLLGLSTWLEYSKHIRINKDMYNFIHQQNAEQLAAQWICKSGENEYALNIASVEDYGYFSFRKGGEHLLNTMLTIFNPIINWFIIWAQTGVLDKKITQQIL